MNKKIINISLILFIAFTLYNTLIPFNFNMNGSSFMQLLKSADWALFVHQGNRAALTDIAGNILLFIPLGLLLFLWGRQYKIRGILFLSVLAGFVLSTFIEVLQLFIFQRNSSVTDIFNNTLGTFLGAFGAAIYFKTIAEVSNRFLRSLLKEQPLAIILVAILGFQIVGAIIPFNVSITVSDLIKSLKKINIIPFHNQSLSLLLFHRPLNFDAETFNWFAFVENILFWSVWGYISGLCYHFYWKFRRFGSIIYFGVIIVPPLLIEFLQIFIVARFSDVNDILSAWTGIVLGLALCLFFKPFARYDGNEIWRSLKGALILYYIFRFGIRAGRGRNRNSGGIVLVAIAAGQKWEIIVTGLCLLFGVHALFLVRILLENLFGEGSVAAQGGVLLALVVLVCGGSLPPLRFLRQAPESA